MQYTDALASKHDTKYHSVWKMSYNSVWQLAINPLNGKSGKEIVRRGKSAFYCVLDKNTTLSWSELMTMATVDQRSANIHRFLSASYGELWNYITSSLVDGPVAKGMGETCFYDILDAMPSASYTEIANRVQACSKPLAQSTAMFGYTPVTPDTKPAPSAPKPPSTWSKVWEIVTNKDIPVFIGYCPTSQAFKMQVKDMVLKPQYSTRADALLNLIYEVQDK